jgi:hypothetical protein
VDGGDLRAKREHERVCERLTKLESMARAPQPVALAADVELLWQFVDAIAAKPVAKPVGAYQLEAQDALNARVVSKRS